MFWDQSWDILSRSRLLLPSQGEMAGAFADLTIRDGAFLACFLLWLVVLFLPLKAIDRRDPTTGFTYVAYMMLVAVVLVLVLPEHIANIQPPQNFHLGLMAGLATVAGWRWSWRHFARARGAGAAHDKERTS